MTLPNPFPGIPYELLQRKILPPTGKLCIAPGDDELLVRACDLINEALFDSHDTHIDIKWINIRDFETNPDGAVGHFLIGLTRVKPTAAES